MNSKSILVPFKILFYMIGLTALSTLGLLAYLVLQVPSAEKMRSCFTTRMNQVELCPSEKNYVRLRQIAKAMRQAVVLSEDASFYQHQGFDWDEIKKSYETNRERKIRARGGSTITQQLAKNLFLTQDKTIIRKLREAFIAQKIEKVFTKDEILERYLNVVQFGKEIYGVKAASQYYFSKLPSELTLIESSFLAFLLPSPERYASSYFKKSLSPFAKSQLKRIMTLMYRTGKVSAETYQEGLEQLEYFPLSPPAEPEGLDEFDWFNEEPNNASDIDAVGADQFDENSGDGSSSSEFDWSNPEQNSKEQIDQKESEEFDSSL